MQEEGRPVDKVFIIQKGEFQVTQTLMDTRSGNENKTMNAQEYRQSMARGGNFRNMSLAPVPKAKPMIMPVGLLSVNNLIGEDDVFDSYGYYRTTVKCIS